MIFEMMMEKERQKFESEDYEWLCHSASLNRILTGMNGSNFFSAATIAPQMLCNSPKEPKCLCAWWKLVSEEQQQRRKLGETKDSNQSQARQLQS